VFTALVLNVTAALALCAGVARAEVPALVSYGNFAAEKGPLGVAVDQSGGDVYIAGLINLDPFEGFPPVGSHIDKFDASGKLLSPSPFAGEGFYSGVAVNPTDGDVDVIGQEQVGAPAAFVDTYDPDSGALLSSFPVPASANTLFGLLTSVQIATDSTGDVYVPVAPDNEVLEYSPAPTCSGEPAECVVLKKFTGAGEHALSKPTGVAVDQSGNVWIADDGDNRIEEFGPTGAFIGEIKSEGVRAVALDAHGDVFAVVDNRMDSCGSLQPPCDHMVEYSTTGTQLADVGAGDFGSAAAGEESLSMPAVEDSSGRVYVTDAEKNLVWMFGPPTAPHVESELAVSVTSSAATLGVRVNPGGIDASYRFEYGTTATYGPTAPFPEGDAGTGVRPTTAWASVSELLPGTTYHYRVVVSNAIGKEYGLDQTFTTSRVAETECPNESLRTDFSADLPDCRAYEPVTPPNSASAQPDPGVGEHSELEDNFAASDGDRMAYRAADVLPGSQSAGEDYVATRGANGWSSENELPAEDYYKGYQCSKAEVGETVDGRYSPDLAKAILTLGGNQVAGENSNPGGENEYGGGCGGPQPELVSGEPKGVENLFVSDNADGSYQLVDVTPLGVTPTNAKFVGTSADLDHVVFEERAKLTPDALSDRQNLYEWSEGVVRLVTNGSPVPGSYAGISADGSHVFFTAEGKLYTQVNGTEPVQVDASQAGGSGGGGKFVDASTDGSRVFFTDEASAGLTGDTVAGSGTNLYEYTFQSGTLIDLTPAAKAEVVGGSDASEDGSYIYFAADGVLTGTEANEHGEAAQSGQPNLYLRHGGKTTFISTGACVQETCRRIVPSGTFYAFDSTKRLTSYDNTDANTGASDPEIYLYDAATNSLVCASCNPSGEAPTSGTAMTPAPWGAEVPHYLAEHGRVFFETPEALLPTDSNGQADVYEYKPSGVGVGGCGETGGCLYLISTGTGLHPSKFIDASASGDDVFLLDEQALTPQSNAQEARTIYDARVDGGFPSPSSPPPCTTPEACRSASASQPAIFGAPASQTFEGAGNLAPPTAAKVTPKRKTKPKKCAKGHVKRKSRCVKPGRGGRKAKQSDNKREGKGQR
jgi:hypothetical protein